MLRLARNGWPQRPGSRLPPSRPVRPGATPKRLQTSASKPPAPPRNGQQQMRRRLGVPETPWRNTGSV
eukprot:8887570-Lingulodinium_polyedra.AAC.1